MASLNNSNYNPIPFTVNLPQKKDCLTIRNISDSDSFSGARSTINTNFQNLNSCVSNIQEWMDVAFDYKNGPLGVLNLHSDVDYAVPPKELDVLTWRNNQWTNFSLTDFGNITIQPFTLNQLTDVEHVVNPVRRHVLMYDPQQALIEQTALRNSGVPDVNGFVYYEDGNPIPDASTLQGSDPNAPGFVQAWISRHLQLNDLKDVSETLSNNLGQYNILYFDPNDTGKTGIGQNGGWKALPTVANDQYFLGLSSSGLPTFKAIPTSTSRFVDLLDIYQPSTDACGNPSMIGLEYDRVYQLEYIQVGVNGAGFNLVRPQVGIQNVFQSGDSIIVCSGRQYIVSDVMEIVGEVEIDILGEVVVL